MADSHPILDHIVILVSYSTLLAAPKTLEDHFIVTPGGEHAGGLTRNNLILLQDGVYIELIAFHPDIDPELRRTHRWGASRENTIVDWGYTLSHESDFSAVQERVRDARAGITYADPSPGGRTRPDGVVLEWSIGAAQDAAGKTYRPGSVPFWCLDRTPRDLRVPYKLHEGGGTAHPSGVSGVSRLVVRVRREEEGAVRRVCDAIHGDGGESGEGRVWRFEVPEGEAGGRHTVSVSAEEEDGRAEIRLALKGRGPSRIELFPGLVVDVE